MGRMKTCLRRVTDITGPDLLYLVALEEGGVILKIKVYVIYERVTRS